MLAMSMGCARCHDHKKDPIKAKDYYAFLSFFEGLAPYRPTSGGTGLSVEHFARRVPPDGALAAFEQQRGEIAAVIMEPLRSEIPPDGYLAGVGQLAREQGARGDGGAVFRGGGHFKCDSLRSTHSVETTPRSSRK